MERKLDSVRAQKQMAYDLNEKAAFELLHIKEDLIGQVRLIKSENETEGKPKRKPRQKKISVERVEGFQDSAAQTDNSVSIEDTADNDKQKNEPEQLSLDF